jgi:hypothetical protein
LTSFGDWRPEGHETEPDRGEGVLTEGDKSTTLPVEGRRRTPLGSSSALCHLRSLGGPDTDAAQRRAHAEQARASLSICLGQRNDFAWAHLLLAVALTELSEFKEAEREFDEALKRAPDDAFRVAVLTSRGAGYFRQGKDKFDEAVKALSRAAELQPDSFRVYLNLSKVYKQRGEAAAAVVALDQALSRLKGNAVLLYTRADLYLELAHNARLLVRLACIYAQILEQPRITEQERFSCQERSLELLRLALALQAEADRAAFWHNEVRPEAGLTPLRGSIGWRQLDRQYPRPQ